MKTRIRTIIINTVLLLLISMGGFGQSPTITGFAPDSGAVGTLVSITGTNLSSPTAFTIGGVSAIVISNTGTSLVGMVMPGAATGAVSVTTSGGIATGSINFTVTATPYPDEQLGAKRVGTGATGAAEQGSAVAVSANGNTAIVGGFADDAYGGAAWIYTRTGSVWSQQGAKLVGTPSYNGTAGEEQGKSVAISADGNTALVGAPTDSNYHGAAWVFTRSGTTWTQQAKLVGTGAVGTQIDEGAAVALSADGNTAVIGGIYDNSSRGAVWVFTRSAGVWTQMGSKLVGTGSSYGQGESVSISADGKTIIESQIGAGGAWIFTLSGTTWSQQDTMPTGGSGPVAISADGNTAARGLQVFTRSGTTWAQQGTIPSGTGAVGSADQGTVIAMSADGNTIIESGYNDSSGTGAFWVFTRSGATWTQQGTKLVGTGATGTAVNQASSLALSADGTTAISGGPGDNSNAGAAWFFVNGAVVSASGPDQTACLNATVTTAGTGTGTWTALASNPATTTIASPTSPITTITGFTVVGSYGFKWATDTLFVTVHSSAVTAFSLSDTIIIPGHADTLSATGSPAGGTYQWSPLTNITPTNGTAQTVTVTPATTRGYCVAYTVNGCTSSACQTVHVLPPSPGPGQTICVNGSVTMAATGAGTWTALSSNPATTTITTPSSATTTVTGFSTAGTYYFVWTNTGLHDTMSVVAIGTYPASGLSTSGYGCLGDTLSLGGPYGSNSYGAWETIWYQNGNPVDTTYPHEMSIAAGGNGAGSMADQLHNPGALWMDSAGYLYVVDYYNYRIQRFPPGSTSATAGVTIAGGNGSGIGATQLQSPEAVYVDGQGNIYVNDFDRVQKFPPGSTSSTSAVTVAGNIYSNTDSLTTFTSYGGGLFLDNSGNIYVSDNTATGSAGRVLKFPPNSTATTNGTVAAGSNGNGLNGNQIQYAQGLWIDSANNLYVVDWARVLIFPPGSTVSSYGVQINSGFGIGGQPNQFYDANAVWRDKYGSIYVGDPGNERIQKYAANSVGASAIASYFNRSLFTPNGAVCVDDSGYMYASDASCQCVRKLKQNASNTYTPTAPGTYTAIFTSQYGCSSAASNPVVISSFLAPSVTISASQTTVCTTSADTFMATSQNGGNTATYQWYKNGIAVGTDSSRYIVSNLDNSDSIWVVMTSSIPCASPATATSSKIYMTVNICDSAGPDQTICINSTATMAATGTGTWTALASNPHTATITNPSSPTTTISGFTVAGVYGFTWAGDTVYVTVGNIIPVSITSTGVTCFGDSNGRINTIASGGALPYTYVWSPIEADTNSLTGLTGGNYCVTVTDHNGCSASACTFVTQPAAQFVVSTDSLFGATCPDTNGRIVIISQGGTTPYTYIWSPTGYNQPDPFDLPPGIYCLTATDDNGCTASLCDTVRELSACTDTVWPGDVDANHIVDNNDLLPIGLGYDSTGPIRAVPGIVWQGDAATDWDHYFTIYAPLVNFNHADCNGDGIIDADDTLAIVTNFGDVHAKTNNLPGPWRSNIPGVSLLFSQDTIYNNDTLTVGIIVGSSSMQVSNIYGLAFTFNYDPLVVDSNYSMFNFIPSWLGDAANSININRNLSTGQVKAAITGTDHIARSGYGQIAAFRCIITTDNINGKNYSYYNNLNYISDITAIDQYGNLIPLNAGIDSNYVGWFANGINPVSKPVAVNVYPNPANDQVRITSTYGMTGIRIIDIVGNEVQMINSGNKQSEAIDISRLSAGVYTVHVSSPAGVCTAKLIISR